MESRRTSLFFLLLAVMSTVCYCGSERAEGSAILTVDSQELDLVLGDTSIITFFLSGILNSPANLSIKAPDKEVLEPLSEVLFLDEGDVDISFNLTIVTVHEGKVTLQTITDSDEIDVSEAFVVVSVQKNQAFDTVAIVLGWISTIAWDVSFLPQIWHNYRRNSVSGLSFDFLTFNLLGFSCYLMFNAGMLWIPAIQDQFSMRNPNEVLHVRLNDVIFPLYAVLCTVLQIVQCFLYPKEEGQRVSLPCRIISALLVLLIVVGCILVPTVEDILWIDILFLMSYVKLFISMIKYSPQLFTNYKARSTEGWSIGQVILDFTGGVMSLIQMFLLAANYDDYNSVLTDPTKLGLGLLSIFFNIFFFIQHYFLYRGNDNSSAKLIDDSKEDAVISRF